MLPEPFQTILFLLLIPALANGLKILRERRGKPMGRMAVQIVVFVLCGVFLALSGGFAGLSLPALPVVEGDFVAAIGAALAYLKDLLAVIGAGFAMIVSLYEVALKALFERAGFATQEALIRRGIQG